jgi:hypothetical protein
MAFSVWEKCRYKLGRPGMGSDQWSDEDVIAHGAEHGYTLCGLRVGTWEQGWIEGYRRQEVTCKNCLRRIAAMASWETR